MFIKKIIKFLSLFFIAFLGLLSLNITISNSYKINSYEQSLQATETKENLEPFYSDLKNVAEQKTIKLFLTSDNYQSVVTSLMLSQYFLNDKVVDDGYSPIVFLYQQQLVNDQDFSINITSNIPNWFDNNYPKNKAIIQTNNSSIFNDKSNLSYTAANVLTFLDYIRVYFHDKYTSNPELEYKPLLFDIFLTPKLLANIWDNHSIALYNFLAYVNRFHLISNDNYLKTIFLKNYVDRLNDKLINKSSDEVLNIYQEKFDKIFVNATKLESSKNFLNVFSDDSRNDENLDVFKETSLYELIFDESKFVFYDGLSYTINNDKINDKLKLKIYFYEKIYDLFFKSNQLMIDKSKINLLIHQYLNIFLLTDQFNVANFFYKNQNLFNINKKTFIFLEPAAPTKLGLNDINLSSSINRWKFDEYKSILKTFRKIYPSNKYNFLYITNPMFDGFKSRFNAFQELLNINDLDIIYTKPSSAFLLFYELLNQYQKSVTSNIASSIIVGGIDFNDDNVLDILNYLKNNTTWNDEDIKNVIRNIDNFPIPLTFLINDFDLTKRNEPSEYFVLNKSYITLSQGLINDNEGLKIASNLLGSKRFFDKNGFNEYDPIVRYNLIINELNDGGKKETTVSISLIVIATVLIALVISTMIFIIYNYKRLNQAKKRWSKYIAKWKEKEDNNA
ncbi:hypothetical protein [Mycoplasma bradburyae]|uniref:Uncharacterized protein n=1 Tax=Mycoplasma bradburyae TaxID=2963128 RepID=A0AAW6HR56_9MOLU|nr:hypothetical protein [Mycoplasma bradburyae]MDC4183638.1 hypothetical protein [Mycoplasma bradburyae]UTS70966.1 hypothetical protein NMG77_00565 [Mycoplasma bradburyae]